MLKKRKKKRKVQWVRQAFMQFSRGCCSAIPVNVELQEWHSSLIKTCFYLLVSNFFSLKRQVAGMVFFFSFNSLSSCLVAVLTGRVSFSHCREQVLSFVFKGFKDWKGSVTAWSTLSVRKNSRHKPLCGSNQRYVFVSKLLWLSLCTT